MWKFGENHIVEVGKIGEGYLEKVLNVRMRNFHLMHKLRDYTGYFGREVNTKKVCIKVSTDIFHGTE